MRACIIYQINKSLYCVYYYNSFFLLSVGSGIIINIILLVCDLHITKSHARRHPRVRSFNTRVAYKLACTRKALIRRDLKMFYDVYLLFWLCSIYCGRT